MEDTAAAARHEFDGNDYQATHVILYAGDEPIGSPASSVVQGFRQDSNVLLFRKAYRDIRAVKALADFAFDHVARKGYDKIITHSLPMHARLWKISSDLRAPKARSRFISTVIDEPCIELVKVITPPLNAISEHTDVAVLFRTEGFWDAPSEFEMVTP